VQIIVKQTEQSNLSWNKNRWEAAYSHHCLEKKETLDMFGS